MQQPKYLDRPGVFSGAPFGALAPLLKLSFLYVLAPLWFFLGYEREGWKVLKNAKWILMMAGILILTEAWYHYAKTARVIILPLSLREHLQNLKPVFTWNLWQAQFISRVPELVLTYSGLFLAGLGLFQYGQGTLLGYSVFDQTVQKPNNLEASPAFFLGWAAVSALYVPLLGEYGLIHRYTLLPLAPISAVWISSGLSALYERTKGRPWAPALLTVLVLGIPAHAALRIKHWYRLDYPYLSHVRETLSRVARPEDLILVATHEKPVHLYYLDRYGYSVGPATWTPATVDAFVARGARFVLVPLEDNPRRLAEWRTYLSGKGRVVEENQDYWLYRMDESAPAPRQG